jgi:hypothetical protein
MLGIKEGNWKGDPNLPVSKKGKKKMVLFH